MADDNQGLELEKDRRDWEDVEHAQQQGERLDDDVAKIAYEAEPTRLSKTRKDQDGNVVEEEMSPYHSRLSKELALGNIRREEVGLILQYHQVINLFIDLHLPDVADIYHAELMAYLDACRGIDGFYTRQKNTITTNLNKNRLDDSKKGLFNR